MSQIPAHGQASMNKVGNAREGFRPGSMAGDYVPGQAGHKIMEVACHFPPPPPSRCYCHPAAFTSLDGRTHQRLLDAYGHSRPCNNNM